MEKNLRSIEWMGDSLKQLKAMPKQVQKSIGDELHLAQAGLMPPHAKPFKSIGSGVFEIRKSYDTDTYRAIYATQIGKSIYVLHAFQKKAKKGIATPKKDVDLIKKRYNEAMQLQRQKKEEKDNER